MFQSILEDVVLAFAHVVDVVDYLVHNYLPIRQREHTERENAERGEAVEKTECERKRNHVNLSLSVFNAFLVKWAFSTNFTFTKNVPGSNP